MNANYLNYQYMFNAVVAVLSKNVEKIESSGAQDCQPTSCQELTKFSMLIKDSTALSLLISCLVKLSNITRLNKIMSTNVPLIMPPHPDIWPNEIPHTVHHDYVSACLMSVLNHAIQLGGANALWLRSRADLLFVQRDYKNALKNYLEAGAAASNFFVKPVPCKVWSNEVIPVEYVLCGCCSLCYCLLVTVWML
jgi:hypothetical protein